MISEEKIPDRLFAFGDIVQLYYIGARISGAVWFGGTPSGARYNVPHSNIVNAYNVDADFLCAATDRNGDPVFLRNEDYQRWRVGGLPALRDQDDGDLIVTNSGEPKSPVRKRKKVAESATAGK